MAAIDLHASSCGNAFAQPGFHFQLRSREKEPDIQGGSAGVVCYSTNLVSVRLGR